MAAESVALPRWVIDPSHSIAEFSVRHMMISTVKGRFGKMEGEIYVAVPDFSNARAEIRINAASIDTKDENRDAHLRSPDFFDLEHHPQIIFKSTQITPKGEDRYTIVGDLSIRGVTRSVTLEGTFDGKIRDPYGNERFGFSVEGEINRHDFGVSWNTALEAGGVMVGDKVKLTVHIEGVQQNS
ncbi:MAG: YceI family protein [Firmicutes bacterium]|nr:YceI family protein [Bacillota bacterium]